MFESVSELTAQIRATLEAEFSDVAIVGEVSNLARPRSGHVYLSLKDESARIRAVIWKSAGPAAPGSLGRALGPGMGSWRSTRLAASIRSSIRRVEPEGIGALELALRQRFERLREPKGCSTPIGSDPARFPGGSWSSAARPARRSATSSR